MAGKRSDTNRIEYGLRDEDYYTIDQLVEQNMERRRLERENKTKRRRKARRKPLMILLAIIVAIGAVVFSFSDFFVVDSIEVEGNKYFTAEEVINMSQAAPGKNLIYHPGKAAIRDNLKTNTYIESVKVRRRLPSTLVIKVKEREQLGAIVYDDDYLIVDGNGILLRKTATEPKITIITGIKVTKIQLGEVIEAEDQAILDHALTIINGMKDNDLYFVRLEMGKSNVKAYIYNYLVCKGTYEQIESGITDGKLHAILVTLFEKDIKRGTIRFSDDGYASYAPGIK